MRRALGSSTNEVEATVLVHCLRASALMKQLQILIATGVPKEASDHPLTS